MTHPLRTHYDLLLLVLAVLALGGSLIWDRRQQPVLRDLRAEATIPLLAGSGINLPVSDAPSYSASFWPAPGEQSRGEGWIFELFAPPALYFDPATRDFALSSRGPSRETPTGAEYPLSVLAVKREPFRLQLAGYFGAPGDQRVALVSPHLPDTFLVRVGDRLENFGLSLKRFGVGRVFVGQNEGVPVYEAAAIATLQDEWHEGEVVLDSRTVRFTDSLLAKLLVNGTTEDPREWREGESFTVNGTRYRIERIQLEPAEVVVSRTSPGLAEPELQVLQPSDRRTSAATGISPQAQPVPGHAAIQAL